MTFGCPDGKFGTEKENLGLKKREFWPKNGKFEAENRKVCPKRRIWG